MANVKISGLPAASAVADANEFEINEAGTSKKVTGSQLQSYVETSLGLGTISTQNANNVSISGGSITGITDLAVADGGTGSSSLTANNVLLGNGTSALQTVAPGTSGNVLTSNGTTWTSAAPTGGGGGYTIETSTVTADVTLTSSNDNYQVITITNDACETITLPDATTMSVGDYFVFDFPQGKPQRICRNGDGDFGFYPEEGIPIVLLDNSTSAGTWSFFPDNIVYKQPFSQAVYSNSTNGSSWGVLNPYQLDIKQMSDDIIFIIYSPIGNDDVYGICYNKSTNSWGSETLLDAGACNVLHDKIRIIPLTSTKALIYHNNNANHNVFGVTLSGTTITAGATTTARGADTLSDYFVYDDRTVILLTCDTDTIRVTIIDVNGSTASESAQSVVTGDAVYVASLNDSRSLECSMCVESNYLYIAHLDNSGASHARADLAIFTVTGSSGSYGLTESGNATVTDPDINRVSSGLLHLSVWKVAGSTGNVHVVMTNDHDVFGSYYVTMTNYTTPSGVVYLDQTNLPFAQRFEDGVKVEDGPRYIMFGQDSTQVHNDSNDTSVYPEIDRLTLTSYLGNPKISSDFRNYAFIGTYEALSAGANRRVAYRFNVEKIIYLPGMTKPFGRYAGDAGHPYCNILTNRKSVVNDYISDCFSGQIWKEI